MLLFWRWVYFTSHLDFVLERGWLSGLSRTYCGPWQPFGNHWAIWSCWNHSTAGRKKFSTMYQYRSPVAVTALLFSFSKKWDPLWHTTPDQELERVKMIQVNSPRINEAFQRKSSFITYNLMMNKVIFVSGQFLKLNYIILSLICVLFTILATCTNFITIYKCKHFCKMCYSDYRDVTG